MAKCSKAHFDNVKNLAHFMYNFISISDNKNSHTISSTKTEYCSKHL